MKTEKKLTYRFLLGFFSSSCVYISNRRSKDTGVTIDTYESVYYIDLLVEAYVYKQIVLSHGRSRTRSGSPDHGHTTLLRYRAWFYGDIFPTHIPCPDNTSYCDDKFRRLCDTINRSFRSDYRIDWVDNSYLYDKRYSRERKTEREKMINLA